MVDRGVGNSARTAGRCTPDSCRSAKTEGTVRRRTFLALVLALALLLPTWTAALAADGQNHAGLVVRDGAGRLTYAYVAFEEETISGVELLRRSGLPIVTVGFGALGEGVCAIGDEGCAPEECRRRVCQGGGADAPYWQYFRQSAPGDWRALALGASSIRVGDGDVDGWSWTGSEARLPAADIEAIARLTGASTTAPKPEGVAAPTAVVYIDAVPAPQHAPPPADAATTAAAVGILGVIGAGALLATRRRRRVLGGRA